MKKLISAFIFLLGCIAVFLFLEERAEKKAKSFCDSVQIGADISELRAKMKSSGASRFYVSDDSAFAMWTGGTPFSGHDCHVKLGNNKVIEKHYTYMD